MNRRGVLALLASLAGGQRIAQAQRSGQMPHVGFLAGSDREFMQSAGLLAPFPRGMLHLGWKEGRDYSIEWRFAEGRNDRIPELVADLLRVPVKVMVLATSAAVNAARQATREVPIVMATSPDPVGQGYVASLAHPGGNVTGLASSLEDIAPKQVELLKTLVPNLETLGLLQHPDSPNGRILRNVLAACERAGVMIVRAPATNASEIDAVFDRLARERVNGLYILPDSLFVTHRKRIADRASALHLPSIAAQREYVVAGGLMSYGESLAALFERTAFYVDKILKGASPADLPVEQPSQFLLSINVRTARDIGLDVPVSILVRADEVIE